MKIRGFLVGAAILALSTSAHGQTPVSAKQSGTWTNTVTQGTAANLNATVVGTGTFATQAAQSGTWNITNVSGTVSLPTGAATSAAQTTAQTSLTAIAASAGTTTDAACANSGSTCTVPGILKGILAATQGTGPTTTGNLGATLSMSTATTTKIITGVSGKSTYVTELDISVDAATLVSVVTGTGTNCGTGTATINQFTFPAGSGITKGSGMGNILPAVGASTDICITVGSAANSKINASYVQQ